MVTRAITMFCRFCLDKSCRDAHARAKVIRGRNTRMARTLEDPHPRSTLLRLRSVILCLDLRGSVVDPYIRLAEIHQRAKCRSRPSGQCVTNHIVMMALIKPSISRSITHIAGTTRAKISSLLIQKYQNRTLILVVSRSRRHPLSRRPIRVVMSSLKVVMVYTASRCVAQQTRW